MSVQTEHVLQWHNYKKLTFCGHCGGLLVGIIKQGLRCKRCEVDIHQKCQEDLKQPCIPVIAGKHNFRDKSYTHPTDCDHCNKMLVGLINQGLKCTECSKNVHEKCLEKIDPICVIKDSNTGPAKIRKPPPQKPQNIIQTDRIELSVREKRRSSTEPIDPNLTSKFATMPPKVTVEVEDENIKIEKENAKCEKKSEKSTVTQLDTMVGEVIDQMANNANKLQERGEKIERLEQTAGELEETSRIFKKKTKAVTKKMWFQNQKLKIIIGTVVAVILIIIIVAIVLKFALKKKSQ